MGANLDDVRLVLGQPRVLASASARPSLTAASCVGETLCGALGITLISCSRAAVGCETRTSPDFAFDNDPGFLADTIGVWTALSYGPCPVPHMRRVERVIVSP